MPRLLFSALIAIPFAIVGAAAGWAPLLVFALSAIALVPLAGLIGAATEALAHRVGPVVGGLLNATFGNAAELIIGITALAAGLTDVVRASIAGSVIGNSLLVLGTSMLLGGWRYRLQRFNARDAGQYASLLAIAVVGLAIPTIVALLGGGLRQGQDVPAAGQVQTLSVVVAVLLLISYAAYIAHAVFGVRAATRSAAGAGDPHPDRDAAATDEGATVSPAEPGGVRRDAEPTGAGAKATATAPGPLPVWLRVDASPAAAVVWLAAATVLTAVMSETLVGAIEPVAHQVGLSAFFIGLIVIPIVGNAAEHSSAISMALRDSMDTTMAITAGSAIQVALLVAPVLVLVSVFVGHPLPFVFIPLELAIFALVALLYALVSLDGESTWLEGLLLLVFYVIVGAAAFFVPV
jgi:Ca2+:H+ antiporter